MLDRDIHDICDLHVELYLINTDTTLTIRSLHLDNGGEYNPVTVGKMKK